MHAHPHVVPIIAAVFGTVTATLGPPFVHEIPFEGDELHDPQDVASTDEWGHYDKDAEL